MCEFWFHSFRAGKKNVNYLERSGATSKVKSVDLQALLYIDSSQMQQKLAKTLAVCQQTISKQLRAIWKIQK